MLLAGCDDGTGPMTMGRQTEGGRAAKGEVETEDVAEGASVDDEANLGVEVWVGVPADDTSPGLDPDDATRLSVGNPPATEVELI